MKAALKAGEKERLSTLRLMLAAIKQVEIDSRKELSDPEVLAVLDKMCKQRRESISQFQQAQREDLADKEARELIVITEFLPAALSDAEIDALIDEALEQTGASDLKGMGPTMAWLKPRLQGRADMSAVSARVRSRLGA